LVAALIVSFGFSKFWSAFRQSREKGNSKMSLTNDRSALIRLNKEIAEFRSKEAAEARKGADAQKRMSAAMMSSSKSSSISSAKSYASTADRERTHLHSGKPSRVSIPQKQHQKLKKLQSLPSA
jgi:hypothetical protein